MRSKDEVRLSLRSRLEGQGEVEVEVVVECKGRSEGEVETGGATLTSRQGRPRGARCGSRRCG